MADKDLVKKVLVVDGMPSNKSVIKFQGDETWHEISQKIQGYDLVKYGIVPGASVDVTFDKNGQVIYLKVKKDAEVKTENKEQPQESGNDTKMWTVKAIAKNKKVIKFEESGKPWDNVSSDIEALDLKAIGIVPKAKVLVTFTGDVVTAISLATVEPEPSPVDEANMNLSSRSTNNSIEAQVALKEAGAIIRTQIENGINIINIVDSIKIYTKAGLDAMAQ